MKYLIKMQDTAVGIMELIGEATIEECIDKWHPLNKAKIISYRMIQDSDIPVTREFREAWCDETPLSQVDISLIKAKDIQLQRLRELRNKKLAETDVEYTRALESNDNKLLDSLKQKRQALRDVTNPLKNLVVSGYNDPIVLAEIKDKGQLKE